MYVANTSYISFAVSILFLTLCCLLFPLLLKHNLQALLLPIAVLSPSGSIFSFGTGQNSCRSCLLRLSLRFLDARSALVLLPWERKPWKQSFGSADEAGREENGGGKHHKKELTTLDLPQERISFEETNELSNC